MILYEKNYLNDICIGSYKKKNKKPVSDTIYTFDIETCSLFNFEELRIEKDGLYFDSCWKVFDYSKPKKEYLDIDKIAIPYIWQFSIEDTVYYGREFMDFENVLKEIADPSLTKVIWVHNLSYEFGFLPNILRKYTIKNMLARDVRKPISFYVQELNIEFRCSYMLTNLKLETAAKEYTNIEKKKSLDYDAKVRTPLSTLTAEELEYCEYDCLCLYHIIKDHYLKEYGHIALIPATATGEIRKALKDKVGFYYIRKMQNLVPEPKKYLKYMACFQGGYTHGNVLNAFKVFRSKNGYRIPSYDIASSYPFIMCCFPLPCSEFLTISEKQYQKRKDNDKYCFIMHVKLHNVKSKYYNHYLSSSRCLSSSGVVYDNGRIQDADLVDVWLTSVDMAIVERAYKIEKIEYIEILCARQKLLDYKVIRFVLDLYKNKTTMKGIPEKEAIYKKSKQYINSLYGCSVTNPLKNSTEYVNNEWLKKDFTMDFVKEVLDEARSSYSTLFYYPQGLFITAWARSNLFNRLIDPADGNDGHDIDRHVIYCDTDSVKFYGDFDYIFDKYNKEVIERYKKVIEVYPELTLDDFMPVDPKGNKRPIGVFEKEIDSYEELITLGAKKYAFREDGELHITVSGVSKEGVDALEDNIDNFKPGFEFGYKSARKMQHTYNDHMTHAFVTDYEGNVYKSELDYGIILQPTTYTLGITEVYDALISYYDELERRAKWKKLREDQQV